MDDDGCLNKLKDVFGPFYHRSSRTLCDCLLLVVSMKLITRTWQEDSDRKMYVPYLGCDIRTSGCHFRTTGNVLESQQQHDKIKITPKQTEQAAVNQNKVNLLEKKHVRLHHLSCYFVSQLSFTIAMTHGPAVHPRNLAQIAEYIYGISLNAMSVDKRIIYGMGSVFIIREFKI